MQYTLHSLYNASRYNMAMSWLLNGYLFVYHDDLLSYNWRVIPEGALAGQLCTDA